MGLVDHMKIGVRGTLLYVWSLEKFLRGLNEMREIFQEGADGQQGFEETRRRLKKKPYLNPWRELSFADTKLLVEEQSDCHTSDSGMSASPTTFKGRKSSK